MNVPSPMMQDLLTSEILEYDLGEMVNVIRLADNNVIWSGLKLAFTPELVPLPEGTVVKTVGAFDRGFAVVTDKNEIYQKGYFFEDTNKFVENQETGFYYCEENLIEGRDIVKIGGGYRNRYALVGE